MLENVGKFKIAVHDFVLNEGLKTVKDLNKILDGLFFRDVFLFLQVGSQVSLITILENEVNVINSLLDIDESNNIVVSARFEHLNLVIEKLCEFTFN
jgi:hypothetical protein